MWGSPSEWGVHLPTFGYHCCGFQSSVVYRRTDQKLVHFKLGVVVHGFTILALGRWAGWPSNLRPAQSSKFQVSQGNTVRPKLRQQTNKVCFLFLIQFFRANMVYTYSRQMFYCQAATHAQKHISPSVSFEKILHELPSCSHCSWCHHLHPRIQGVWKTLVSGGLIGWVPFLDSVSLAFL